ncbi:MAG: DUF4465 domain-containing protein [Taibaiella sp.]|nr:DUF4465 domain-containing protein [Taibaiella sp.]
MRKILLTISAAIILLQASAQTVSDFESLTLSKPDTFYVNYSMPGKDVGFDNGLAHFQCVYDTVYGGLWESGFAYSNEKDSIDGGYMHPYSTKSASGYSGSANYVVANITGVPAVINLKAAAAGHTVQGFYITNSTYAYNSMLHGDGFAHKFGDTTGRRSGLDWFKLTVYGYSGGVKKPDSVDFYLADFRFTDNSKDYILKDWKWLNLLPLGHIDSLSIGMSSSDTNHYGMLTPAYFCMDNFTTNETNVSVANTNILDSAKVYPIPATDKLYISLPDNKITTAKVYDLSGRLISDNITTAGITTLNISSLIPGTYILQLLGENSVSVRFVKQ